MGTTNGGVERMRVTRRIVSGASFRAGESSSNEDSLTAAGRYPAV
jgi:hypothetical protein